MHYQINSLIMKRTIFIILTSLLTLIISCTSAERKARTISISGAFALYPLVVQWAEAYEEENPGIRFNISAGGAGKGMADALSGTVDLGMFSREIATEEINKGAWWVGLTKDAVLATISKQNPYLQKLQSRGLSRDEFASIFIEGEIVDWGLLCDGKPNLPIVVYTRSDACGAAGTWAQYLGGTQEELKGIGIYSDPGLADAVVKDRAGIGYNNTVFIYDVNTKQKRPGLDVVPIDLNNDQKIDSTENFYENMDMILNAISMGKYPSPPARELYFVANGKPEKESVLDFIRWTLTKGQAYVEKAGYVPITGEKINEYLKKIQ